MNFNYATLVTLWDANGKNHINGIENFFQRECVLLVANKVKLSTRTMILSMKNKYSPFKNF